MSFEVKTTPHFEREAKILAKRYKSFKADMKDFIESLEKNPMQGDELSPGIRKIRLAIVSPASLFSRISLGVILYWGLESLIRYPVNVFTFLASGYSQMENIFSNLSSVSPLFRYSVTLFEVVPFPA